MRTALLLSLCCSLSASAKEPATLADLKVLAEHKSWPELLERAEDVAPAGRTDAWREAVGAAATAVLQSVKVTKDPFEQAARADSLRERYAFLATHAAFLAARDEAVMAGAQRCLGKDVDDACWKALGAYELTLSGPGSLKLGKLLRKSGFVPYRPVALFARAVGAKDAAACKDADVQDAVLAALGTPEDSDTAKAGRQVAFEWCFATLEPKLKASMVGATTYRLKNSCTALREKKALSELQVDLCQDVER